MADIARQKTGGNSKKIGRSKRKGRDTVLSALVRGKTTPERYLKAHGLTTHHAYIRKAFNLK